MITYEDECVGCPPEMGCLGELCRYKNVVRKYCDCCEEEVEDLYVFDDEELCVNCLLEKFEKI